MITGYFREEVKVIGVALMAVVVVVGMAMLGYTDRGARHRCVETPVMTCIR